MDMETLQRVTTAPAAAKLSPVFKLGPTVVQNTLKEVIERLNIDIEELLVRHAACDWGVLQPQSARLLAATRNRLLSVFRVAGRLIAVETEWNCTATRVYLINLEQFS
ncbi:hypothetical protein [Comamonas sp.]|uniref:hypothetical protein n=1 Tax=Comamonas sp. TaxID=34028 RepID=UPI00258C9FDA|nr:hypothetical protein [Comamonas sp.]